MTPHERDAHPGPALRPVHDRTGRAGRGRTARAAGAGPGAQPRQLPRRVRRAPARAPARRTDRHRGGGQDPAVRLPDRAPLAGRTARRARRRAGAGGLSHRLRGAQPAERGGIARRLRAGVPAVPVCPPRLRRSGGLCRPWPHRPGHAGAGAARAGRGRTRAHRGRRLAPLLRRLWRRPQAALPGAGRAPGHPRQPPAVPRPGHAHPAPELLRRPDGGQPAGRGPGRDRPSAAPAAVSARPARQLGRAGCLPFRPRPGRLYPGLPGTRPLLPGARRPAV